MIKIDIGDADKAHKKYLKMVKPKVIQRLKILETSLRHLDTGVASECEDDFRSYKHITRKLMNLVATPVFNKEDFDLGAYKPTVENYYKDPANLLCDLKIDKIYGLVNDLLKNDEKELNELLICPADDLKKKNLAFIKDYKIGKLELKAVKLAFDYEGYEKIAKRIKKFFRKKNFALHCPYCNVGEADHSPSPDGGTATSHHLDHFHDKSRSPLLSYSLYNLVPSDTGCNSTFNKGTINFSDDYHLNPYSAGFNRKRMVFEPQLGAAGQPLKSVYLKVIPAKKTPLYKQLVGNSANIIENRKRGNINVFKLKTKYNKPELLVTAGDKVEKFYDLVSGRQSLTGYLTKMKLPHTDINYKAWYKKEIGTYFDEADFHKNAHSKLFRDLHDDILKKDVNPVNDDLRIFSDL